MGHIQARALPPLLNGRKLGRALSRQISAAAHVNVETYGWSMEIDVCGTQREGGGRAWAFGKRKHVAPVEERKTRGRETDGVARLFVWKGYVTSNDELQGFWSDVFLSPCQSRKQGLLLWSWLLYRVLAFFLAASGFAQYFA